jgi:hypothetical protein
LHGQRQSGRRNRKQKFPANCSEEATQGVLRRRIDLLADVDAAHRDAHMAAKFVGLQIVHEDDFGLIPTLFEPSPMRNYCVISALFRLA